MTHCQQKASRVTACLRCDVTINDITSFLRLSLTERICATFDTAHDKVQTKSENSQIDLFLIRRIPGGVTSPQTS